MRLGGTKSHFQLHVLEDRDFQQPLNVQETRAEGGEAAAASQAAFLCKLL